MRKFAYFIAFCCLLATVRALNCRTGYKVSSQIITGDEWVDEECPTDDPHSCIRSEGVIVIFGAHTGELDALLFFFFFKSEALNRCLNIKRLFLA